MTGTGAKRSRRYRAAKALMQYWLSPERKSYFERRDRFVRRLVAVQRVVRRAS
jgi:hypothetical protein